MSRTVVTFISVVAAFQLGCKVDLFGPPPRPSTNGYRAVMTIRGPQGSQSFEIAVRGGDLRRALGSGETARYLVRSGAGPVLEVDPVAKTFVEVGAERLLSGIGDYPLAPGFTDAAEAARRGVTDYHRESDTVFAGHACQLWRFDDVPGADLSPTTTYWIAPSLENLVVRRDKSSRGPDGTEVSSVMELTNVRTGADPELFVPPRGYGKLGRGGAAG